MEGAVRLKIEQLAVLVERIERPLESELPMVRAAVPAIFAAGDRFPDVRIATEARTLAICAAAGEVQDIGADDRLMIPVAKPDELQSAGAERKFIIATDVALITSERLLEDPLLGFAGRKNASVVKSDRIPIWGVGECEIADRARLARRFPNFP